MLQASRDSAPVLVAAPHATIVDAIAIMLSRSVPVAKQGLSEIWFIGVIGKFLQVLFVNRDHANARKDTSQQIKVS
jgi:1-acyl-sn-glycerol-3-phosphate acyltransferase